MTRLIIIKNQLYENTSNPQLFVIVTRIILDKASTRANNHVSYQITYHYKKRPTLQVMLPQKLKYLSIQFEF